MTNIPSTDLSKTPMNFLTDASWKLVILRIPTVTFLAKEVSLPEMTISGMDVKGRGPRPIKVAGVNIEFGDLAMSFAVDEDLKNYRELCTWMRGVVGDPSENAYRSVINDPRAPRASGDDTYNPYSQGSLFTTTNKMNVNIEFVLEGLFPKQVSGLRFVTDSDGSTSVRCDVVFSCEGFEVKAVR